MDLKNRIINSAYELFSTKGYDKTTIGEIIKHAECSKGGFYHHFKSKEEILEVIISNYIYELTAYFKDILNDKHTFIYKFNAIFKVISQYKLKQLDEWSKINNVFYFAGNDRILRQLEKQFKIVTAKTYYEVISMGEEQGMINVEYPVILAELCTREIIWIYEAAGKLIYSKDEKEQDMFEKLLCFSEDIVSYGLGVNNQEVKFKDVALSYLRDARESYLKQRGE